MTFNFHDQAQNQSHLCTLFGLNVDHSISILNMSIICISQMSFDHSLLKIKTTSTKMAAVHLWRHSKWSPRRDVIQNACAERDAKSTPILLTYITTSVKIKASSPTRLLRTHVWNAIIQKLVNSIEYCQEMSQASITVHQKNKRNKVNKTHRRTWNPQIKASIPD